MDYDAIPKNKTVLMANIASEWSALLNTVEQLTTEQMIAPDAGGWSPKDNLAHLTAWEQFMIRHYIQGEPSQRVMQVDETTYQQLDEDGMNRVYFERNRDRSTKDVLDDFHDSHRQVLEVLEAMDFAEMMKPKSGDPDGNPLILWVIGNTYEHYREHRLTIQAILGD